jgi:hypothetical protein
MAEKIDAKCTKQDAVDTMVVLSQGFSGCPMATDNLTGNMLNGEIYIVLFYSTKGIYK